MVEGDFTTYELRGLELNPGGSAYITVNWFNKPANNPLPKGNYTVKYNCILFLTDTRDDADDIAFPLKKEYTVEKIFSIQ